MKWHTVCLVLSLIGGLSRNSAIAQPPPCGDLVAPPGGDLVAVAIMAKVTCELASTTAHSALSACDAAYSNAIMTRDLLLPILAPPELAWSQYFLDASSDADGPPIGIGFLTLSGDFWKGSGDFKFLNGNFADAAISYSTATDDYVTALAGGLVRMGYIMASQAALAGAHPLGMPPAP